MSRYHIDYLDLMTATGKLYQYLLVIVDGSSKFVWIYPTKTTNMKEVLNKLQEQQKTFENLLRLLSDRGSIFTLLDFHKYCDEEHIEHILITTRDIQ